jgi:amidophosphoribosyltransferase
MWCSRIVFELSYGGYGCSACGILRPLCFAAPGQESAGIAVSDGHRIKLHKGMGMVSDVIREENINQLPGNIAIGHVRYSTTGESGIVNAQPMVFHYLQGMIGLAHNGNLVNTTELRKQLATYGSIFQTTTDTELIGNLLARYSQDKIEDALAKCMIDLKGAFALVIMTEERLIGVRDPMGIRPLCLGRFKNGISWPRRRRPWIQ